MIQPPTASIILSAENPAAWGWTFRKAAEAVGKERDSAPSPNN